MPKPDTRRRSTNTTQAPNITVGAPSVVAHPVARPAAVGESDVSQLAEALAKVSPGFNRYMSAKQQQYELDEADRAIADAALTKEDVDEAVAKGLLRPEQSPWYQKAFMAQMGQNMAARRAREIATEYETSFDKDGGDINAFISERLAGDLQGMDDLDFKSGYLQQIRPLEANLRNAFAEHQIKRVREQATNMVAESMYNALDAAAAQRRGLNPAELKVLEDNARELGITREDFNDLLVKNALVYALQGDGNPEVLQTFKNKGVQGPASFYYSGKYGKELSDAEAHVTKLRKAADDRKMGLQRAEILNDLIARGRAGEPVEDEILGLVEDADDNPNGFLSASGAVSLINSIKSHVEAERKRVESEAREAALLPFLYDVHKNPEAWSDDRIMKEGTRLGVAPGSIMALVGQASSARAERAESAALQIGIGEPGGAHVLRQQGVTEAKLQDALDASVMGIMSKYKGDPIAALPEVMDFVIKGESGLFPSYYKSVLNNAKPGTPSFAQAAGLYAAMTEAGHEPVLSKYAGLSDEASLSYYDYMSFRRTGDSHETALEKLAALGSPEGQRMTNDAWFRHPNRMNWTNHIRSEFSSYGNAPELIQRAQSLITSAVSQGRAVDLDLVKWATKRVKDSTVELGGKRVFVSPENMPGEHFDDAVSWKLEAIGKQLGRDPDSLTLSYVPNSQQWEVRDKDNYYAIRVDGKAIRVDARKAVAEYLLEQGNAERVERVRNQTRVEREQRRRDANARAYHKALDEGAQKLVPKLDNMPRDEYGKAVFESPTPQHPMQLWGPMIDSVQEDQ